jgi:DNA-binding CsgD family transcriptional regulator
MPISLELVGLSELSAREKAVFELVVRGLSNRKISEELCITERTAKFHAGKLLAKCGRRARIELLALCLSGAQGIEPEPIAVRRRELKGKRSERDAAVTRQQAMATAEAEVRITLCPARAASFSQYPVASQMGCHVRTFGRRLTKRGRWSRT